MIEDKNEYNLIGEEKMLDCRKCNISENDCEFKNEVLKAIDIIEKYTGYRVKEEIEGLIENTTGLCEDFEPVDCAFSETQI